MTPLQSITEARQNLNEATQSANSRELALNALAKKPTPDHLLLCQARMGEEFGVRWIDY